MAQKDTGTYLGIIFGAAAGALLRAGLTPGEIRTMLNLVLDNQDLDDDPRVDQANDLMTEVVRERILPGIFE